MDIITLSTFGTISLIIAAIVITSISKAQIKKKTLLLEINNATMNFDKIDELKKRNLDLKYLIKLQAVEQLTIEAKFLNEENITEMAALYNRASHLPSKAFKKSIETQLVVALRCEIGDLEKLSAPESSEVVLKNLPVLEKAAKNIAAQDIEHRIKKLGEKHKQCSGVGENARERLSETN